MADTPVIELRGVGKTYYNADVATPVLFDMSFQVGRGEFVAIVGGSGSGNGRRVTMRIGAAISAAAASSVA